MRNTLIAAVLLLAGWLPKAIAQQAMTTTTFTQETGNNTSAANTFAAQPNGNAGAGNVSKVSIRTLLYPGATTKMYAHVMPWWGHSKHMDIGYNSHDPAQARRQINDMISRGFDGLAVDWYGQDSFEAGGVKVLFAEAERHPGFGVFVEVDHGAMLWDSCFPGCDPTTAVIQLFTRVANDFFDSPAYLHIDGRPVLREFALAEHAIDWNQVQAQVPGNPLIIHRNINGFGMAESGGAFGWIEPQTGSGQGYDGTDYLDQFYAAANAQNTLVFGAVFKGFNDIMAGWSPAGGRHVEQNCGQTWLQTFAVINKYFSADHQLPLLQLVTWNDYEEGTEVETGIDNCVTIAADVSGSRLSWTITGDESTIDHYTVFVSKNGEVLASLADLPAGVHATDLAQFALPAGDFKIFVKAIGKPSLRNQMSAPVTYSAAAAASAPAAVNLTLSATPPRQTVMPGAAANFDLNIAQDGGKYPVMLSCSSPAGVTCSLSQSAVDPGASQPVQLTVYVGTVSAARRRHGAPLLALWSMGALGLVAVPAGLRRRRNWALVALIAVLAAVQFACGGGHVGNQPRSTSYEVTVNAASGLAATTTTVTVTVN